MSKIPGRNGRGVEVDHRLGELRKPDDYASQPEQGGAVTPPNPGHVNPLNDWAAHEELDPSRRRDPPPPGRDRA